MASKDKTPPDGDEQEEHPPTLEERVENGRYVAYGQHSLVTEDGEPDTEALIQRTFDIVVKAVVERPTERKTKVVTRTDFMDQIFPKVPGREAWSSEDDPELAEKVYGKLNTDIWRLLDVSPTGPIQSMLNGEHSLLLCRVDGSRLKEAHAYVTRNRKCLDEDYSFKARMEIERAVNKHAALMAQAIDRIPEHAASFVREHSDTSKALSNGMTVVKAALEMSKSAPKDDAIDDDIESGDGEE